MAASIPCRQVANKVVAPTTTMKARWGDGLDDSAKNVNGSLAQEPEADDVEEPVDTINGKPHAQSAHHANGLTTRTLKAACAILIENLAAP
jgi:hypothetical protein